MISFGQYDKKIFSGKQFEWVGRIGAVLNDSVTHPTSGTADIICAALSGVFFTLKKKKIVIKKGISRLNVRIRIWNPRFGKKTFVQIGKNLLNVKSSRESSLSLFFYIKKSFPLERDVGSLKLASGQWRKVKKFLLWAPPLLRPPSRPRVFIRTFLIPKEISLHIHLLYRLLPLLTYSLFILYFLSFLVFISFKALTSHRVVNKNGFRK